MSIDKKLRLAGAYLPWGEEQAECYYSDGEKFFDEDGNALLETTIQEWALWLNSPWSFANFNYDVRYNCNDEYTSLEDGEPKWKSSLIVVGYDGVTAILTSYGDNELDSLLNCKKMFDYLQKTYNPKGESV